MLSEYIGLFLYFGLMLLAGGAMILLSHLLQIRVKGEKYDWTKPYECGLRSEGLRMDRYPVHYYLVGILFVIFDVEIIFFVPWAVVGGDFREAGLALFWFVEMLVFLFILLVGYVYLLKRGVFNWGGEYD
ncbi:NADH-quinone oxidoreductase subunit A [bacterium]|nr:NADH-quinone oxidoreductase subunit A [bacterium]